MVSLELDDFHYDLPDSLIAQQPLAERSASRLMVLQRQAHHIKHECFKNLPNYLQANDLLVINNTRVMPARLRGHKNTGGRVECLIERILDNQQALVHLRSNKSLSENTVINLPDDCQIKVIKREGNLFIVQFPPESNLLDYLHQFGEMPLPTYIRRSVGAEDEQRYQTIFAKELGAVAAPTAGLHFDQSIFERILQIGVNIAEVTLHVGAGTFQPVRVQDLSQHQMHSEFIEVKQSVCDAIKSCQERAGRVIAVGTTVVRCLETASQAGILQPYCGESNLFITPGFNFKIVDALITNFHLPKSTLLMLVSAFAGHKFILNSYHEAILQQYRFFSYGDAMLIC